MTTITRQFLDFARRRGPEPGSSDVCELRRRVLDLLRPFVDRRRVALKLDPAEETCVAAIDYNQIQQALSPPREPAKGPGSVCRFRRESCVITAGPSR